MFVNAIAKLPYQCGILRNVCPLLTISQRGHMTRGKPPGVAKNLEQRLQWEAQNNQKFVEEKKIVDIGFPAFRLTRAEETKLKFERRKQLKNQPEIEKLSRNLKLDINIDRVKEDWLEAEGQYQIKSIAEHYGIYEHLFGYAYFLPRISLDIKYIVSENEYAPVYYGNTLKPTHAKNQPEVKFDAKKKLFDAQPDGDTFWTLILTNPDGHFTENDKEYVHWFVGNIPNGDVPMGEVVVPYLQPFPPKGTGYHRHIFILYKQDKKLDFSSYRIDKDKDLTKRTFKTYEFYRKMQDNITPAGLAFFQSDYDTNLTEFYHNVLEMKEPIYEYDFPKTHHPKETYFPLKQPFNLYLDRYRDPKQINKEFLVRELKKTHPFNGPEPPLRFPGAHSLKNIPQWLITEKKKTRLGHGRINELREEYR